MNKNDAAPGRFDRKLGAWVFSSYADVSAALNEPRLSAGAGTSSDAHDVVRAAARQAFSVERVTAWQREMETSARQFAAQLQAGVRLDLIHDFAEPWTLSVAARVIGVAENQAQQLAELARIVFLAAAHSTDGEVADEARNAATQLAQALTLAGADAAIATQTFIALTQTLPCFLGAAWLALLQHPDQFPRLRSNPEVLAKAVEELLRYAGPSRAVFRRAASDAAVGAMEIKAGQRVVLLLAAANRDPARFPDPDQLNFDRDNSGMLALGRGTHYCVGAQLIRTAVRAATHVLLDCTSGVASIGDVEWIDGFAIRGPATLPVVLQDQIIQVAERTNIGGT